MFYFLFNYLKNVIKMLPNAYNEEKNFKEIFEMLKNRK